MRFKSLTNDQTFPRYRYFNFYKPHKVDGKGFSSQMPTLKTVPSDQKSNRRTCAEECQMPFKTATTSFPKYSASRQRACCVRRRRTHTNRVVFTEITLAGFVDQCRGCRS